MKVILASNNNGKIKEFKEILSQFNIEVLSLKDIGFNAEIEESGQTFFDNALIKAKTIFDIYQTPVISDDSGLCIHALDDAPGVYSARYGGLETADERNNLVLKQLENQTDRRAYFHCSIIFYIRDDKYEHFEGRVFGNIEYSKKGDGGFGYDVIFIPNGYQQTFGELPNEIKNKISHRANALKSFMKYLENDFSY